MFCPCKKKLTFKSINQFQPNLTGVEVLKTLYESFWVASFISLETTFCAFLAFTLREREQPVRIALLLGISNMCTGAEPPGRALYSVESELPRFCCSHGTLGGGLHGSCCAAEILLGLLIPPSSPCPAATQAIAMCFVSLAGKWQDRKRCENFERQ